MLAFCTAYSSPKEHTVRGLVLLELTNVSGRSSHQQFIAGVLMCLWFLL